MTAPVVLLLANGGFSPLKAADDKAQICVARFGYVEHATSRWTNSQIECKKSGKKSPKRLVEFGLFEISLDNACLVIHSRPI